MIPLLFLYILQTKNVLLSIKKIRNFKTNQPKCGWLMITRNINNNFELSSPGLNQTILWLVVCYVQETILSTVILTKIISNWLLEKIFLSTLFSGLINNQSLDCFYGVNQESNFCDNQSFCRYRSSRGRYKCPLWHYKGLVRRTELTFSVKHNKK